MKRYLLFATAQYYPNGGWDDFKGNFDTREEAEKEGKERLENGMDYYQIIDTEGIRW